ncbi:unnamed protein product, partial [Meganyctiphanes norvegica]
GTGGQTNAEKIRAKKKYRASIKALLEIRAFQRSTNLLIPKRSFQRLVKEIFQGFRPEYRVQTDALEAMQEATEAFVTELFADSTLGCYHANRKTIKVQDMQLAKRIRGRF